MHTCELSIAFANINKHSHGLGLVGLFLLTAWFSIKRLDVSIYIHRSQKCTFNTSDRLNYWRGDSCGCRTGSNSVGSNFHAMQSHGGDYNPERYMYASGKPEFQLFHSPLIGNINFDFFTLFKQYTAYYTTLSLIFIIRRQLCQ